MDKRFILPFLLFSLITVVSCARLTSETASEISADIALLVNADIITMNAEKPSAGAMAISGNRIVAIGSESEVRTAIGEYSRYHDLNGKTIVPGFFESHDHLYLSSATISITDVSPFTTPTLAEALDKIQHTQPDSEGWIVAFGADQELYQEQRGPTRNQLDELFPKTPVMVFHLSGHGGFVNSEALRLAGVNESTPNPTGGFFEKDESGQLTGYLGGQPALFAVKAYPNPTPDSARSAAFQRAAKGVTTASEFGIMNLFMLEGLQQATSSPDFPVRVVGGYFSTASDFEEIVPRLANYENELLTIPFVKTWTDGSLQGGTGHLSEGYHTEEMGSGGAQGSQEFFNQQVLRIYQLGYWPAIHANGDAAVEVALNAVEYAQQLMVDTQRVDIRPQIIHAQYTHEEQIARMAELGVYPTFFTTHVYYWGDLHHEKSLGPDRAQRLSAMADGFKYGVKPSMHNDPPVSPVDPLLNMWIAVKRASQSGRLLGADQAISAHQALEAYTINAAYQFGMEQDAGSLEVGKFADFVVLDRNPLKIDPNEIRNVHVLATVRGGMITYSDVPEYDRIDPPPVQSD